jgi:hypothetical protein
VSIVRVLQGSPGVDDQRVNLEGPLRPATSGLPQQLKLAAHGYFLILHSGAELRKISHQ